MLLQDLLIGVTNFFRDPQAFEALEREVIPKLFEGKGPDDTVRVWVPGCSTGEEAYSIAILLREHMPKAQSAPRLQIFASDIDEQSLQIARVGRFPSTIAADVPPARLERYFVREDGTYRIASDLREICLFSSHNLLRDAPFSKLDLVACRNLLIYLVAGAAESPGPAVPLRAERRRLPVPGQLGERHAPFAPVQHRRQGASHLPAPAADRAAAARVPIDCAGWPPAAS